MQPFIYGHETSARGSGSYMKLSGQSGVKIAFLFAAALLMASVSFACGGDTTVVIKDFKFDPTEVTIKVGDSVTWENEDRRSHQIMSGAPPVMTEDFVSPNLASGDSWTYTFEEAGEYPFHSMTGGILGWVYVEE
jgi:plastocyanin